MSRFSLKPEGWVYLKWKRIEAGNYESEDGRFSILKTWDRLYGNHWSLRDSNVEDYYKSKTACDSLAHAKYVAELTVNREKGIRLRPQIDLSDDSF